jgi:ABC-type phosphate transport system permease subunit
VGVPHGDAHESDDRGRHLAGHRRHVLADFGAAAFAIPIGVPAGIYLAEYSKKGMPTRA